MITYQYHLIYDLNLFVVELILLDLLVQYYYEIDDDYDYDNHLMMVDQLLY